MQSGPSHLVSDLTSDAGWEMIDCPRSWPEKGSGTVRLVCTAADPSSSCDHVHEQGAVNTVVRLPEECGTGPFARIAAWKSASDQSVPVAFSAVAGDAEVFEAVLDYNFALLPTSRGTVSFDVRASNDPEVRRRINTARDVPLALRSMDPSSHVSHTAVHSQPVYLSKGSTHVASSGTLERDSVCVL